MRYAIRSLLKAREFTLVAMAIIAIGIANGSTRSTAIVPSSSRQAAMVQRLLNALNTLTLCPSGVHRARES